jgi:sulfur-oxidizing protein SoxY
MISPKPSQTSPGWTRRRLLRAAGAGTAGMIWVRSGGAAPPDLAGAIAAFAAGASVREGRVDFDIAPLVENGNAVPITVKVDSPMSEHDHVRAIAVFNERNPQRDVGVFHLGPRAGRAQIATRIRLATSQKLTAVAQMNDGSCWTCTVDVIVTLAACVEP